MQKIQSLILLVQSLSKSEKKIINLNSQMLKGDKKYMDLYNLIVKQKISDPKDLQEQYIQRFPKNTFHPIANYLYEYILDSLIKIKNKNNDEYELYIDFLKVKLLDERKLDFEYSSKLNNLETKCKELNNFTLLFEIQQMKAEYIRQNKLYIINEDDFHNQIYETSNTLKILRQINEQSTLYQLLMHRIINSKNLVKYDTSVLNDLVMSEISLNSNLKNNIFEIDKTHLLFQAQYLIFVNDYKAALNTFIELENLFNNNKYLWINRPYIYMRILEGILDSLKGIGKFEEMEYFIQKINNLESSSQAFITEKNAIIFIYQAIIYINQNQYKSTLELYDSFRDALINKITLLNPHRYLHLSLYLSIIFFLNNEFEKARRQITKIIHAKNYEGFSLYRIIQLLNLTIHYELKNIPIMTSRIRSIKRLNKLNNKTSELEDILFYFFDIPLETLTEKRKENLIKKIENTFQCINLNPIENNMTLFFDFKNWMLEKIKN